MKKIRLIGIQGDHHYELWLKNIRQVLHELEIENQLEEVNQIDAILNYDISAVPALVINNTTLLEQNGHIPDQEEIKHSILSFIKSELSKNGKDSSTH